MNASRDGNRKRSRFYLSLSLPVLLEVMLIATMLAGLLSAVPVGTHLWI
jgi:hypothetical protein